MKFIIGNWKSHGTMSEKESMLKALKNVRTSNKIILCLPFTLLYGNNNTPVIIGAQDVSIYPNGSYTGDISAQMLKDAGVKYVLVGHGERRFYYKESDARIKTKAKMAISNDITPIICVGESEEEHKSGRTMSIVKKMVLDSVPNSGDFIIAYEPRWAIGSGVIPSRKEIETTHETIFKALKSIGKETTPILYGGSVNADNAPEIISIPHVDGLLVGGASLKPETFLPIINKIK